MIFHEYDQDGNCTGHFDHDPRNGDVVKSWMDHTNQEINRWVDRINAECRGDYLARKDPDYVNYNAPCMCYVDCELHGPQIGERDYPHKETSPKGICEECTIDFSWALSNGVITLAQIESLPKEEIAVILRDKVYGKRHKPSCPTFKGR